jgi:alkanesulfonate monooxygenase SsuD/methylene tetrahydromethanopterin reductase-like flavin-dependent oxidoreductase (luciferase family)
MRFGITLPIAGVDGDVRKALDYASMAEKAGWDGVFIEDYVYFAPSKDPVFDPWITMAGVAARTEKIRMGITVTPLARRRPWMVAKQAATLDHLSGGRLILGIGVGASEDRSFGAFGDPTDINLRAEMTDEALDVILGLWTGRPFSHRGKHYQVNDVTMLPKPVNGHRVTLWIGGGWPRKSVIARAAKGDGACCFKVTAKGMDMLNPSDVREMKAIFTHRPEFDIVVGGTTPGDKPAKARAQVAPLAEAGATWWSEFGYSSAKSLRRRIEQGPPRS